MPERWEARWVYMDGFHDDWRPYSLGNLEVVFFPEFDRPVHKIELRPCYA